MSDQPKIRQLAVRVMSDKQFALTLLKDPEATLRSEGIEPTPEILDALKGLTPEDLEKLAATFNDEGKAM